MERAMPLSASSQRMTSQPSPPVVLVTGASAGIGAATARAFVAAGFTTYATARRPEALAALADAGCRVLRLDVTDPASIDTAIATVERETGGVDLLVNNAGTGPLGPVEEATDDMLARLFDTNVFGLVRVARAVLPGMRRRGGGRILNVSSMGGEFTTPYGGAYHASKHAVEALSDALRFEVAPFGIDVVVIQPGPVATTMATTALGELTAAPDSPYHGAVTRFVAHSQSQMAAGRGVLQPDAVASVIVRAATSRRPRTRYKVGVVAHALPRLRRILSDRAWDGMWRRLLPAAAPVPRTPVAAGGAMTRRATG